jgi:hypothetical protein
VVAGLDLSQVSAIVTGAVGRARRETGARARRARRARDADGARRREGRGAAEKIRKSTGNPKVDVIALELMSLDSVRAFAKEFAARHGRSTY